MSDPTYPASDDSWKSAYCIFGLGGATQCRTNEGVTSIFVTAKKEEVADDLSYQASFQPLHDGTEAGGGMLIMCDSGKNENEARRGKTDTKIK